MTEPQKSATPLRLLVFSASLRKDSLNTTLAKLAVKVIEKNGGNISKAAKELGLTRTSLYRRMEKYGL